MTVIETTIKPLFTKAGLSDDPDWSDPGVDAPDAARVHELNWELAGPTRREAQVQKLQFFITFRNDAGVEKAGQADVEVLLEVPPLASAESSAARSAWKKIAVLTAHPHDEGFVVDAGGAGNFAVRLSSLAATGATKVFVAAQQWGGT
ncbi:MAG TPA: hypothetical protein PKA64_13505 [Myxococcota bacterium]|nr:hypothetical protein [Myxococcota bacterium]